MSKARLTDWVTCSNEACGHVFVMKDHSFARINDVDSNIEEVGVCCPACRDIAIAYRTNPKIRELQKRVRRERENFRLKIIDGFEPEEAEKGLNKALKDLKREFEAFNSQFKSG